MTARQGPPALMWLDWLLLVLFPLLLSLTFILGMAWLYPPAPPPAPKASPSAMFCVEPAGPPVRIFMPCAKLRAVVVAL